MARRLFIGLASATVLVLACASIAYLLGWWIPNDPGPAYPVRGIDVSHHQGPIDWKKVAASGVRFAFIKATEGADYQDERFHENVDGARAAGIPCGAYHFFTLGSDGDRQAENFLSVVAKNPTQLPPVIDMEVKPGGLFFLDENLQRGLEAFRRRLARESNVEPIVYCSGDYRRSHLKGVNIPALWLRAIFWTPDSCGITDWRFWQYSEKGRVDGIHGFVDMDVFNGSRESFQAWLAKSHGP
jgi:lysozyme